MSQLCAMVGAVGVLFAKMTDLPWSPFGASIELVLLVGVRQAAAEGSVKFAINLEPILLSERR